MLVMSDMYQQRAGYWEAAKWVAKLRAMKTDNNLILFRTELTTPQHAAAEQIKFLRDWAAKISFMMEILEKE